jgi:DNA-binding NarL/FixJ family response regulator
MATERLRGRPRYDDLLTPAEWRVAEAVRYGLANPEIARLQGVSTDAVKYHVANILQKLELSRRNELRHWTGVRRDSLVDH